MKNYKHVIWDWNGTLMDDAWLCVEIMNGQLQKYALPPLEPSRYEKIFRFPVIDYYRDLGYDFDRIPFETFSDAFIEVYNRRWPECKLRPGAERLVQTVAGRGIPQSILSAAEHRLLERMVSFYGMESYFLSVKGISDHHAHSKLELGRHWVQQLAIDPRDTLLVGDTLHDFELAQELGLDCILVYSGHQSLERLASSGVPVFDSLQQVEL
jgi:phosphoglycolate phosphatase